MRANNEPFPETPRRDMGYVCGQHRWRLTSGSPGGWRAIRCPNGTATIPRTRWPHRLPVLARELEWQGFEPAEDRHRLPLQRLGRQAQVRQPAQDRVERDLDLRPRQSGRDGEVN